MKRFFILVLTSINTVMFVASAAPPDSRRSDESIRDIAEEEQRRRRGRTAATLWAEGGCGRSLRRSSSTMSRHRLLLAPRPRLTSPLRKYHRIYGREHLGRDEIQSLPRSLCSPADCGVDSLTNLDEIGNGIEDKAHKK